MKFAVMMSRFTLCVSLFLSLGAAPIHAAAPYEIDETPAREKEWGFRPAVDETLHETPPGFCWRPQRGAAVYELQCSREKDFARIGYQADGIEFNVHAPAETLPEGEWYWRFRFRDKQGAESEWSLPRRFTIAPGANELPLPAKADLLARIPTEHPRLFVRPEEIAEYRRRAQSDLKPRFDALVDQCEKLIKNPPPTSEPPLYPDDVERKSEEWREIWWGNRTYTISALNGAATLAFTRLIGGKEEYGQLAKRILMDCAEWNPTGATGFRYNDEAGMPYNYYFSRTYTFVNDLLSEAEKEKCRAVMRIRGQEMYDHLYPKQFWTPYESHANRAWHFLGEVGIAFLGEIPEAGDWAWFAANEFKCVYPVWSDSDGGWHEGNSYWNSYMARFTWWADVMRVAMGIDAFKKPYFAQVGYYPLYLMPPGTQGGGFGDLNGYRKSENNVPLMSILAAQARNPYWEWYVETQGGPTEDNGYIGFIRGALPQVEPKAPTGLPTSRAFHGVGQAMLNTNLLDAKDNVEVVFKSSPFGTQSHGYESQNSFLLYAFGERLFIRTGRRDIYGSPHHQNWMWHTKSTNCVTINGEGQIKHSAAAVGEISRFETGEYVDYVEGEAGQAYGGKLERFTRRILFIKPYAVVVFDTLKAPKPVSFEWRLHAVNEMKVHSALDVREVNGAAACKVSFLWPRDLSLSQTDRFDPPPRERIKLVEYHLTATPENRSETQNFVTVFQPYRSSETMDRTPSIEEIAGGFAVTVPTPDGETKLLLQNDAGTLIEGLGLKGEASVIGALSRSGERVSFEY
ncbi:MAG: DUF4962 domain-containing protein [bacterium]|nr:DUF4962 domain-containing protein [bacterium]